MATARRPLLGMVAAAAVASAVSLLLLRRRWRCRPTEVLVREALKLYFRSLHTASGALFDAIFHPRGLLLGIGPGGQLVMQDAVTFRAGVEARERSAVSVYTAHDRVLSISVLDARSAIAKVQVALPPVPNSLTPTTLPVLHTVLLVFLREGVGPFKIISKIFSSAPLGSEVVSAPIQPADFATAAEAVWAGYTAAGRACDGDAMARIFHPRSQLTFATAEGALAVIDAASFCERVVNRWQTPEHAPYAHLASSSRAASADTLLSLDFAGPGVAVATLRIGYPPLVYDDVLSLLKLRDDRGEERWWIVAKSSVSRPFLKEEANR
mmetsp:Transcript_9768/g.30321  ORF Transcript_9768/g.30321 Transcript_9768/m.30321 type:complete len:324 (-) Transcript_9768:184-1155(-)